MNRFILQTVILLWGCAAVTREGRAASTELATSRARFDKYVQTLNQDYRTDLQSRSRSYRSALEALMKKSQEDGDLDTLLRIKDELNRFERVPVLTERSLATVPGPLQALQKRFLSTMRDATITHSRAVIAFCESYAASLDMLESRLTISADFDGALEVRTARSTPGWDNAAITARFELALVDSGPAAVSRPPGPEQTPAGTPIQAPESEPDKISIGPEKFVVNGIEIYTTGSPSREQLLTFKRADLNRTAASSLRTPWSVSALIAREETKDANSWYVAKDTGWRLRMNVKSLLSAEETTELMVVVRYYVRPAIDRGKTNPRVALTRRVSLVVAPGAALLLEYPPFNVWTASVKGGQEYGNDFYGFEVSLFDPEGKLLFQSVSERGLSDLASATLPPAGPEESASILQAQIERARAAVIAARAANSRNAAYSMRLLEAQWQLKTLSEALKRITEQ